ncbi:hypothetical protein Plant_48 [Bacillus phage poppyseed]|uniref:Uncharacterized protein n=2 Tax=Bacillus phage Page TaxID=1406786 RepID=U5PVE6_9CAUD|nr:hypothetical protein Page_48 [Bacillus phage Page]AGY47970.1 hypothetical protein Page_48 [Bacillus phage Page]AGY48065.1 hypothetical protein Plant_48 [Bacillus phage poppyseed]
MNEFEIVIQADRIAPYKATLKREHNNIAIASRDFAKFLLQEDFIFMNDGTTVRTSAITSFKVKLITSIKDGKEIARERIERFLQQNGPAITVDSIVHVYQDQYLRGYKINPHVKAVIESNKNELELLTQEETK